MALVKVWNGSSWVDKTSGLRRWNGSAWVSSPAVVKFWNGTTWATSGGGPMPAYVKRAGEFNSAVSQTSFQVTMTTTTTAGNVLGALLVNDSAGSLLTASATDSKGNTWTMVAGVNQGSTLQEHLFFCPLTSALVSGDTITFTLSVSRGRWVVILDEFIGLTTSAGSVLSATNTASTGTTMTTGNTSSTATANYMLYAGFGTGSGRTHTAGTGWTGGASVTTSAGSSDRMGFAEWRTAPAAGVQSGTADQSPTGGWAGGIMAIPFA